MLLVIFAVRRLIGHPTVLIAPKTPKPLPQATAARIPRSHPAVLFLLGRRLHLLQGLHRLSKSTARLFTGVLNAIAGQRREKS